eukprot:4649814-Amphidinium_carterae.2
MQCCVDDDVVPKNWKLVGSHPVPMSGANTTSFWPASQSVRKSDAGYTTRKEGSMLNNAAGQQQRSGQSARPPNGNAWLRVTALWLHAAAG